MWCRTILTAVAISYVICMLLWSGLQTEDLDPSTVKKLGRYNVNIDDMNNEQLRQECLIPHVTTEVQREILKTSTANERNEDDVTVEIYPKIGNLVAANFEERTGVQDEAKINMTNNLDQIPVIGQGMPDLGNATQVLGNKGIIKIEYNIQNQPNVENVMNFWTKLTRYTTTAETTVPTTTVAPFTTTAQTHKAKKMSTKENYNNGYVHSREMEYINRILAEYLASQTVPTTTQRVYMNKVFPNYFTKTYWEVSHNTSVEEDPNRLNEQKEINTINNLIGNDFHKIQNTSNRQIQKNEPKVRQSQSVKTNKTIGILQRLLQMRNDLFNNGVIVSESESNTETIKLFTNNSKDHQEASVSFNLFKLFQNMEVNTNYFKNDKSRSPQIKDETWEPVPLSNENLNKELKTSPIGNEENNEENNQEQKFVMYNLFKTTPSKIIKPVRTKIYHGDNRVKDTKNSRLHQNSDMENNWSRFQAMLPSIKYSKQNKNSETTNSQVHGMSGEMDKLQQNENVPLFSSIKAIISQQPAIKEIFARNQLFKMKYDTFNADSGNTEQKSKKIKAIQEIINNFDQDNEQLTSDNVATKATQNVDSMNMSGVQVIPSNIIKQIVENVKTMVLKDIGVHVNTTAVGTTSTTVAPTTIFSTSMSTTISTSEKPSTSLQKEFNQTNHVMLELLEIFKEMKAMKNTLKLANQLPQNTTTVSNDLKNPPQLPMHTYPETPASENPYLMINPSLFKPVQANSDPRIVLVPISSAGNPPQNMPPQFMPPLNVQPTKADHFGAITIQTNADEVAPLAIQISQPLKAVNQNIVVPTKWTVDQLKAERERDSMKYIDDKFRIPNENEHLSGKLESDLSKDIRFRENDESRDPYFKETYLDREKPVYNMENRHPVRSRFPELHYPGRLSHLGQSGRPRDLSYSEDLSHPRGHNRPGYQQYGRGQGHHPGSYSNSEYDRQPRYEATKFHEKLERIEHRPQSAWKDFHSHSDSSNDEISARQQLPLVKVKQRTRYDDTHFANFLKSQQKVTDMLEKLLAMNVKNSGPHSVETP